MDSNIIQEELKKFANVDTLSGLEKPELISIITSLSDSLTESVGAIDDLREAVLLYKKMVGRSGGVQGLN